MNTTGYPGRLKAEIVRQAILTGDRAEALAARHLLPPELVSDWLRIAADSVPRLFTEPAATGPAPTRHAERNFRILFETSSDAIMLLTGAGFFDCNPSTLAIYGLDSVDEFIRLHPSDLSPPVQPDGRASFDAANEHIARAMQTGSDHFEWMHRRRNGEDFEADVLLSCFLESGQPILQATVRDISLMKRLQRELAASHDELARAHEAVERQNRELARQCMTDQLTGLANRRKLEEVIETECRIAQRHHHPVATILADLDHFKRVNDTFGHQCGDDVLRQVAALLQRTVRETDVVGRWGGEEFMIVCRSTGPDQARSLADRLRCAVQQHRFDRPRSATCSFGVAAFNSARGIGAMIREADDALYEAKAAGRNRVVVSRSPPDPCADIAATRLPPSAEGGETRLDLEREIL